MLIASPKVHLARVAGVAVVLAALAQGCAADARPLPSVDATRDASIVSDLAAGDGAPVDAAPVATDLSTQAPDFACLDGSANVACDPLCPYGLAAQCDPPCAEVGHFCNYCESSYLCQCDHRLHAFQDFNGGGQNCDCGYDEQGNCIAPLTGYCPDGGQLVCPPWGDGGPPPYAC